MRPATYTHIYHRRSSRWRLLLGTLGVALAALLFASTQAFALSQRGHTFEESFGATGEGALSDPGAIAVSLKTGDVYVLDRAHGRIVQYGPAGEFISAWGWGVKAGATGKEYEVCSAGDCNISGVSGHGSYQLGQDVIALAVDNCANEGKPCTEKEDPSVGDVYVLAPSAGEYAAIDRFGPDGEPLERTAEKFRYAGGCTTEKDKPVACEEGLEAEEAHGLTVGPRGTVWLEYGSELFPISDVGLTDKEQDNGAEAHSELSFTLTGEPAPSLAVDARKHFYIGQRITSPTGQLLNTTGEWEVLPNEAGQEELGELLGGLDSEEITAIAANQLDVPANNVDEQNDVYVTNVSGVPGKRSTSIAQFAPNGSLLQRFSTAGLTEGAGVAVDPVTGAVYVTDAASGDVDLFALEGPGPPTVDGLAAHDVSPESATLEGRIDPVGTSDTTYVFEYGTSACTQEPASCIKVKGTVPGGGYGDETVTTQLQSGTSAPVLAGTTYHYRVIVQNEHGSAASGEGTFTTPPATGESIADGRGWEMVSPQDTEGAEVLPVGDIWGGSIQAAANGSALAYIANGPFAQPEGNRTVEDTQVLSYRNGEGWHSKDITTPNSFGTGPTVGLQQEYDLFTPNLGLAVLTPTVVAGGNMAQPPLAPPASAAEKALRAEGKEYQEKTLYMRDNNGIEPQAGLEKELYEAAEANGKEIENPGYLALVNGLNAPGVEFGGDLFFEDATPDLTHVVIKSNVALKAEPGRACTSGARKQTRRRRSRRSTCCRQTARQPKEPNSASAPSRPAATETCIMRSQATAHASSGDTTGTSTCAPQGRRPWTQNPKKRSSWTSRMASPSRLGAPSSRWQTLKAHASSSQTPSLSPRVQV